MTKTMKAARILFLVTSVCALLLCFAGVLSLPSELFIMQTILQYIGGLIIYFVLGVFSIYSFIALKQQNIRGIGIFFIVYAAVQLAVSIYDVFFSGQYADIDFAAAPFRWIFAMRDSYYPLIIAVALVPLLFGRVSKPLKVLTVVLISLRMVDELLLILPTITILSVGASLLTLMNMILRDVMIFAFFTALMLTALLKKQNYE